MDVALVVKPQAEQLASASALRTQLAAEVRTLDAFVRREGCSGHDDHAARQLARAFEERVDVRAVTGLTRPDFRTRHLVALSDLFVPVLRLWLRSARPPCLSCHENPNPVAHLPRPPFDRPRVSLPILRRSRLPRCAIFLSVHSLSSS